MLEKFRDRPKTASSIPFPVEEIGPAPPLGAAEFLSVPTDLTPFLLLLFRVFTSWGLGDGESVT